MSCHKDEENAHFYAADMVISAMEKMKCNILSQQYTENWSTEEASGPCGNDEAESEVTYYTNKKQESGSSTSSDSGYEGCAGLQVSPVVKTPTYCDVVKEGYRCDFDEFVLVELREFNSTTETSGCSCSSSKSVIYEPNFNSAELIAKELYQVFWKCWMLSQINYQLAGSLSAVGSLEGSCGSSPEFFCAGCGTPVEPKFVRRLRYCEYLGKYFCDCCHSYAEACIPARILTMWDFRKYYISNFSKQLLESIWHQPIFSLLNISHSLYAKAKELGRVREIQEQLFHIKKLLKTCRFAESTLKEFEQVPTHLTDELHLFSLEDLVRVKKGLLVPLLKDVLKASLGHVAHCELCQGKGFICEFCRSTAVIFPFQTTTCRCSACRACFHKQCFQSAKCPRVCKDHG